MRQLSLDQIYGCSTLHRHGLIALSDNRVAYLAGSYLVIFDCLTNEKRYLSFSSIEYLYISTSNLLMGIIDRFTPEDDTRIHIYSTKPIDLLYTIEPDRFGRFIGITMNEEDNLLMILHDQPAYMITIQEIHIDFNEQQRFTMNDLASVRVVHGSVMNRMTQKEILPNVEYVSFSPYSSKIFCVTGLALFKIYEIENENIQQQMIHFRAEFYGFKCHCWLNANSILTATDHGHIFWIEDGSIRADINLQESITIDLDSFKTSVSNESTRNSLDNNRIQMFKDDSLTSNSGINVNNPEIIDDKRTDILSPKPTEISEENHLYIDLITSKSIPSYYIVSFREYLLMFKAITAEPFFQLIYRYRLRETKQNPSVIETHNIHKMSYIFDQNSSLIYVLTDRNEIFRYKILQIDTQIEFEEKHLYGFHAYSILSIGLCQHKSWLITLGSDHYLKIIDYKDNNREILSKYIPDNVYAVTNSDPYGFHICLSMNNHFHLYSITNYDLRLIHEYETRPIHHIEMSHSGHLIAIITNNSIQIYSTIYFNLISQFRGHIGHIIQILWCRNDLYLLICGTDGMIYLYNILTGMRENEIITKQHHYMGIDITKDCNYIYAIATDSTIKIFHQTNLEQEWKIERDYQPSAICLAKSERLLYIGMTHGIIRIYPIPFKTDSYLDIPAHSSAIRRLLISNDDQYLISIGESAYILLFKQTINISTSISSQLSIKTLEMFNQQKRFETNFEYILITKTEYDEQKQKIKEIQEKINQFEKENHLKLHSKEIIFSKHLNNYSKKYQNTIEELTDTYQQLKAEIDRENLKFSNQMNEIEEKYNRLKYHIETIYENQIIEMLGKIQNTQNELKNIEEEQNNQLNDVKHTEYMNLNEVIEKLNLTVQSKWHSAVSDYEKLQEKERTLKEYITQMEKDIDDDIEYMKSYYENQLKSLNEYENRLNMTVSTLRKRYNSLIVRIESRDIERKNLEKEVKELENRRNESLEELDRFHLIIKKKEDRIGVHDMKLHDLQQQILHVEKRKYVLDYKTKSLLDRIEPLDQQIIKLKSDNQNLEQQLTNLKQQQNDLISKENEYETKFNVLSKQLNLAKINHQQTSKIVQQQKDIIKKAFEYTEINCTTDKNPREELKNFIQNLSNTMKNEQQNEKQLEIKQLMNEWNHQQKWLLNQLHNLSKYSEENQRTYANIEREHRKTLAPFINQLRDLHNLYENIEKKIQKYLINLKIKPNEQKDFLDQVSNLINNNEKLHLTLNKLNENEYHIEIQDQYMQHLSSILFRYQYSTPCIESQSIENNRTSSLTKFSSSR